MLIELNVSKIINENSKKNYQKKTRTRFRQFFVRRKRQFFFQIFQKNRKIKTTKTINSNLILILFRLCHVHIAESSQNTKKIMNNEICFEYEKSDYIVNKYIDKIEIIVFKKTFSNQQIKRFNHFYLNRNNENITSKNERL